MATLPDHQLRLGTGLRGLLNSLGATFGIAFAGIMLQQRLAVRALILAEEAHLASVEHLQVVERMYEVLQGAGEEPALLPVQVDAALNRWLMQEATTMAYHDMFLLMAAIVLLTAVPLLWLRRRRD
jgi:hypothetical protein